MAEPELFLTFVTDEDRALEQKRQGTFFPKNHHRIGRSITKLSAILEPGDRVRVYFHWMRLGGGIPLVSEGEFSLLVSAYTRLHGHLDDPFPAVVKRHPLLFAFGFDDRGSLPEGATSSASELEQHAKTLAQIAKYTSLPSQRAKVEQFVPFTNEANRCRAALRHLGYRHDFRYGDEIYAHTDLTFWGMVLVALLDPSVRGAVLRDILDGQFHIPRYEKHLAILLPTVEAVLASPSAGPADAELVELVERLRTRCAAPLGSAVSDAS